MRSPKTDKKFVVTKPDGVDAAVYSFQTNNVYLAVAYWLIFQRRKGDVLYASTGKSVFVLYDETYVQKHKNSNIEKDV